ncbi:hypothetical protein C8J57DRAFT_1579380 [Mycena rebaudengoi]|nr:hypothetical protein C8J57DRAFT_1579380 [Mycena rebaudengoi]
MDIDESTPEASPSPTPIPNRIPIEADPWDGFDEFQDLNVPLTLDQMRNELDEMLGPGQEAAHWDAPYNQMVYTFRHKMELSSEWVMLHRIAILCEIEPLWFDCCINSCLVYMRPFTELDECPHCKESRYSTTGKPRRTISDVFDGEHYRTLCTKNVVVDGQILPHKYFSGMYDICLGIALDSYLLFKCNRAGPSATPILIQNYCLQPDIRTNRNNTISWGADVQCGDPQTLHASRIQHFRDGDIIAIKKLLNLKGHNSLCPCRSCEMKGTRHAAGNEKIFYYPFTWPDRRYWDPTELPPRSPERLTEVVAKLSDPANTATHREKLAKHHGIKGVPALHRNIIPNLYKLWSGKYKGLDEGDGNYQIADNVWDTIWQETADTVQHIPADFVRVLGNIPAYYTAEAWAFWFIYLAPILLQGRFRDPKYHTHLCQLADIFIACLRFTITHEEIDELKININDWIGKYEEYYYQYKEECLRACPLTIHGLVHVPDDMLFCGPSWTTWTFWVERYCVFLQSGLRSRRIPWANLNNNILHVAYLEQLAAQYDLDEELSSEPEMKLNSDRDCQMRIRQRRHISPRSRYTVMWPSLYAVIATHYPTLQCSPKSTQMPTRTAQQQAADALYQAFLVDLIANAGPLGYENVLYRGHEDDKHYFSALLGQPRKDILPHLPQIIPSVGKLRIVDGDSNRSTSACGDGSVAERNMSFIRLILTCQLSYVPTIYYGRLERILVCRLPKNPVLDSVSGRVRLSGRTRLLAVITPCTHTQGKDTSTEIVGYQKMTATTIVTDLQSEVAVVGRAETRGSWRIIDRQFGGDDDAANEEIE